MNSLSRTLAVRFSLTMFAALILIGAAAYFGTGRILRRELDAGLRSAWVLQTNALEAGHPVAFSADLADFDLYIRTVNRFITTRSSSGAIVSTNGPLAASLPWPSDLGNEIRDTVFVTHEWQGRPIRSLIAHVPSGVADPVEYLQVTASLAPVRAAQDRIFNIALTIIGLAALGAFAGGGWLVRSSMAPVAAITAQAQTITPETRGMRITAAATVQEFRGLVAVLNDMLDRLDDGLRVQRRIISDVGHDLRTPITAMRGEIEVILRGRDRDPQQYRAVLESCLEEIDRLGRLSDTLILLARLDSGELVPHREGVDIADLARERVQRARERWNDHEFAVGDSVPSVIASADSGMVQSVIDQLLENVEQHTPPGTHGTVAIDKSDSHVTVTVSDDGPGLDETAMAQLFDRFYRADQARTRSSNVGLGLAVIAAIAHAHGGRAHASKSSAGGLQVQVTLPTGDGDSQGA